MQEIDFQDLLIDAWNKFKERWKPLCLASLLGYFIPFVAFFTMYFVILFGITRYQEQPELSTLMPIFIGCPIFCVILFLFAVGTENYCMKICRGQNPETKDFFLSGKTYLRIIVASFLEGIIISIAILLCVIPGMILAFFFAFVSYAIIDHPELGIIDCFKHSWRLVKKYWKPILILFVINYAIQSVLSSTIVGIIPCYPFGILLTSLLYTKFNDESANNAQPVIPPSYQQ